MTPERKSKLLAYLVIAPIVSGFYIFFSFFILLMIHNEEDTPVKRFILDPPRWIIGFPFGLILAQLEKMGLRTGDPYAMGYILDAILFAYLSVFAYRWVGRRVKF